MKHSSTQITRLVILLLLGGLFLLLSNCRKNDFPKIKPLDLKLIADGMTSPIGVIAVPGHSKRFFVIDQVGKIWIIDENGNRLPVPFMDIGSQLATLNPNFDERGLIGLAFHPRYKDNGRFFIHYNRPPRDRGPQTGVLWNNLSRNFEFHVSGAQPMLAATGRTSTPTCLAASCASISTAAIPTAFHLFQRRRQYDHLAFLSRQG